MEQLAALQRRVSTAQSALRAAIDALVAATGEPFTPRSPRLPDALASNCTLLPNRLRMLDFLPKNARVAEVGTLFGDFAKSIREKTSPRELHVIDVDFSRFDRASFEDDIAGGSVRLHTGDSSTILAAFSDGYFDWIYIDGDHAYPGFVRDIEIAARKVKVGGLLVCNDYTVWSPAEVHEYGVLRGVNEFCVRHQWEFTYLALHPRGYWDVCIRQRGPSVVRSTPPRGAPDEPDVRVATWNRSAEALAAPLALLLASRAGKVIAAADPPTRAALARDHALASLSVDWSGVVVPAAVEAITEPVVILVVGPQTSATDLDRLASALAKSAVADLGVVIHGDGPIAREAFERPFLEHGFARHPLLFDIVPFVRPDLESSPVFIPLRRLSGDLAIYSLDYLADERMLHLDMAREPGRRSDAHLFRYHVGSWFVREGDRVLDLGCGYGYGAHMIAERTAASAVIGVDDSARCVAYAASLYGQGDRVAFRQADVRAVPENDCAFDFIAAFEILEHVPDPAALLSEAYRLLAPGGRIILSVPYDWADETGKDPNPHHFDVYDWPKLRDLVGARFTLERAWIETAGGGQKLREATRNAGEFPVDGAPPIDAEWLIVLASKAATAAERRPFRPFGWGDDDRSGAPVVSFAEHYENPWLVKSMISRGFRTEDPARLVATAHAVLDDAGPGSPDHGAALCVIAYAIIDATTPVAMREAELERRIERHLAIRDAGPHGQRWAISLLYARALLARRRGDRAEEERLFAACAAEDALAFSPTLVTKTASAALEAGLLAWRRGAPDRATELWTRGLALADAALAAPLERSTGSRTRPAAFGYNELSLVARLGCRLAKALSRMNLRQGRLTQQDLDYILS